MCRHPRYLRQGVASWQSRSSSWRAGVAIASVCLECRVVSGSGDKMLQYSCSFSYWLSVRNFYINLLLVTRCAERAKARRGVTAGRTVCGCGAVECGLCQGDRLWLLNYELNWRQQLLGPASPGSSFARCPPPVTAPSVPPQCVAKALKLFFTSFSRLFTALFLPVLRLSDSVLMAF